MLAPLLLALTLVAPLATPLGGAPDAPAAGWPDPRDAPIRPGVQVTSPGGGQCTSNFVFVDARDGSFHLGLAAHCVDGLRRGERVQIGNGLATGTVAYSSWATMDRVGETDEATRAGNDFALVRVDDAYRALVSPSVRHFGGPTGLADSSETRLGQKVLTYGNSQLRGQVEPASWHEGFVVGASEWTTLIYTVTPGLPGDSGSAVLTGDGRALGVLVTLHFAPFAGANGVANLDLALAYAETHAGVRVSLATWDVDGGGIVPVG